MTALNIVIAIAVLALIIYRQVRPRPLRSSLRLPLILAVAGLAEMTSYLKTQHSHAALTAQLAGSLVLAAAFGIARARTVRLFFRQGQWWTQGSWLTAVLWVVSLAAHLGYDALLGHGASTGQAGNATILLYAAVTYAAQWLVAQARAARIPARDGV
jgi:hypothetical protein